MSVTEQQFEKALAEFQQFGPRQRITRVEALARELTRNICRKDSLRRFAGVAMPLRVVRYHLLSRFVVVASATHRGAINSLSCRLVKSASAAWSQAMYFAMRE